MGKLKPFLFGTIFGGGIAFVALQYHLVQSDEGFRLIPRSPQPSIGLAYADIRGWGAADWSDRTALAEAVIADGSTDLITTSVTADLTNALAPKGSALDKLRGLINEDSQNPSVESSGFLAIPRDERSSGETSDLFSIPFPDSASKKAVGATTARNGSQPKPTNVARRELPSIDQILGTGSNAFTEADKSEQTKPAVVEKIPSSFDSVRETAAMEDLLFGDDEKTNQLAEPVVSNREPSGGLFEEITSEVQERTGQTFNRVQSGLQDEARKTLNEAANSMDQFARDQFKNAMPDSVSSMFQQDPLSEAAKLFGQQRQTAPAYNAVQEGYDPFVR